MSQQRHDGAEGLNRFLHHRLVNGAGLGAIVLAGLLCLSPAALTAWGAENAVPGEAGTPSKSPVRIQSENMVADMNANTAEFSDQVRVVEDTYTITADILTIYFKPPAEGQSRMQNAVSAKDISRMTARGNVLIRTERFTASADLAEYEPDTGRVTLMPKESPSPRPTAANNRGSIAVGAGRPIAEANPVPGRVRVTFKPSPEER